MSAWEIAALIVCVAAFAITSAMLVKTAIDLGAEMAENAQLYKILDLISKTQLPYTAASKKEEDA